MTCKMTDLGSTRSWAWTSVPLSSQTESHKGQGEEIGKGATVMKMMMMMVPDTTEDTENMENNEDTVTKYTD